MRSLISLFPLLFAAAVAGAAPAQKAVNPEILAPEQCRGMVEIPAGEFFFGNAYAASKGLPGNPPSRVTTGVFLIDKCETTWRQYLAYYKHVLGKKGFNIPPEGLDTPVNTPVTDRCYDEAGAYCKYMGKRLPTEEEWEKAARGGTETLYYWGDEWPGDDNGYEWNIEKFVNQRYYYPVGTKKPNPYGLYDMLGNVREMTSGMCDKGGSTMTGAYPSSCGMCFPKMLSGHRACDLGWRCVKNLKPLEAANGRPASGKKLRGRKR